MIYALAFFVFVLSMTFAYSLVKIADDGDDDLDGEEQHEANVLQGARDMGRQSDQVVDKV